MNDKNFVFIVFILYTVDINQNLQKVFSDLEAIKNIEIFASPFRADFIR